MKPPARDAQTDPVIREKTNLQRRKIAQAENLAEYDKASQTRRRCNTVEQHVTYVVDSLRALVVFRSQTWRRCRLNNTSRLVVDPAPRVG